MNRYNEMRPTGLGIPGSSPDLSCWQTMVQHLYSFLGSQNLPIFLGKSNIVIRVFCCSFFDALGLIHLSESHANSVLKPFYLLFLQLFEDML